MWEREILTKKKIEKSNKNHNFEVSGRQKFTLSFIKVLALVSKKYNALWID